MPGVSIPTTVFGATQWVLEDEANPKAAAAPPFSPPHHLQPQALGEMEFQS
jgi:hypothetical protein